MKAAVVVAATVVVMALAAGAGCAKISPAASDDNGNGTRYGFYRSMGDGKRGGRRGGAAGGVRRRVFGGAPAPLSAFPAACALLDRYWTASCSAAVVAARWALTAAHCVTPHVAYVKYNARRPSSPDGAVVSVHYLYRHPGFKVVQEDKGRGVDVTVLHHDLGLVRTRDVMALADAPRVNPLRAMQRYNPIDLENREVQVLGFGRTEKSKLGEELFSVDLRLVFCSRGAWFHCMCGVAGRGARESGALRDRRGVCSGDSGGPVLYRGAQVGVTSMGPMECASASRSAPAEGATSVFTSLYSYAGLVNTTIAEADAALGPREGTRPLGAGAAAGPSLLLSLGVAAALAAI